MNVPDRQLGVSEAYPLRLVELLSPVTAHRFGPFAALADRLYEPGREGLGTAQLGVAAAIGFVCAIVTVLVRAVRNADRRGWSIEARLGVVMVGALLLGTKGGLSRALELVGLGGVRAWNRIAIVIAFAGMAVFARLLDRVYVAIRARRRRVPRIGWALLLVAVVGLGVLDQAAPAAMPHPKATEQLWHDDGAFVASMERRLAAQLHGLPATGRRLSRPQRDRADVGLRLDQRGLSALEDVALEQRRHPRARRRVAVPGLGAPDARPRSAAWRRWGSRR